MQHVAQTRLANCTREIVLRQIALRGALVLSRPFLPQNLPLLKSQSYQHIAQRANYAPTSPRVLEHEPVPYRRRSEITNDDAIKAEPKASKLTQVTPTDPQSQRWRERLRTWQEYRDESEFKSWFHIYPRLVDEYPQDWELWVELLVFKQRHYGYEGIASTWRKIREMQLDLPTKGETASGLWGRFLLLGYRDYQFMEEMLTYASALRSRNGGSWLGFYPRIMSNRFKYNPATAFQWHRKIKEDLQPRSEHYQRLFHKALQAGILPIFEDIYRDHPLRPMYSTIIPCLCQERKYGQALKWHFLLLEANDFPSNPGDVTPLFMHFKSIKNEESYGALLKSLRGRSEQLLGPDRKAAPQQPPVITSPLSENICARLFATKILPVEGILNGLEMFGITTVNAAALREIVFRSHFDCAVMCEYLKHMDVNGISSDTGRYCEMIREAAHSGRAWLLQSIVESDAHPETFDDPQLQENLLTMFWAKGDMSSVERTMTVLTWGTSDISSVRQRKNLMLRVYLRLKQDNEVRRMLDDMQVSGTELAPSSAHLIRWMYLRTRTADKKLSRQDLLHNLDFVVNAMKLSLECGGRVPIVAWKEILRRLGMNGRLDHLRLLALWLAKWYAKPPPQRYTSVSLRKDILRVDSSPEKEPIQSFNLATLRTKGQPLMFTDNIAKGGGLRLARDGTPINESDYLDAPLTTQHNDQDLHRRVDPEASFHSRRLMQLFTPMGQRAFIAWGFQQDIKQPSRSAQGANHQRRSRETWTWGITLLKDLKQIGVPVPERLVRKQCQRWLAILFGYRNILNKKNRLARDRHDRLSWSSLGRVGHEGSYRWYSQKIEAIWGKDLLTRVKHLRQSRKVSKKA